MFLLSFAPGCGVKTSTADSAPQATETALRETGTPETSETASPTRETADTGTSEETGAQESADTAIDCAELCDDGLTCSLDACDDLGRCVAEPLFDCSWPTVAEPSHLAAADPDLEENQSGATWNAETRGLWLVRNAGPSGIWRLVGDGVGGFVVATDLLGVPAEWLDLGDIESLTLVDPVGAPAVLHVLDEGLASIVSYDLSQHGEAVALHTWALSPWLPDLDQLGAEGLTFVPDAALQEWGFVDPDGIPRTSALGMGGLVLVAHQNGGQIYVFDLAPEEELVEFVGSYITARTETSGIELDAATGRLYLWHGGNFNDLEVARLSSSDVGVGRKLDTEYVFDHPGVGNLEGVAIFGQDDCSSGVRPLLLVEDEGGPDSVELFTDWPLGCP